MDELHAAGRMKYVYAAPLLSFHTPGSCLPHQSKEVPVRYMKGIPVLSHFLLGVFAIVALFSAPANAGWLPETRLTAAPDASYLSANNARCMVTDLSGNIHLVWYDHRDGDADIYYNRFDGVTWGAEIPLTSNATASEDPAIAVDPSEASLRFAIEPSMV
jgi:hypothetical protein